MIFSLILGGHALGAPGIVTPMSRVLSYHAMSSLVATLVVLCDQLSMSLERMHMSVDNLRPDELVGLLTEHTTTKYRAQGIHVGILFEGEGYSTTAGNPAIGSLALGVAACFIAHSVMDKNKSRGKCVKGVKLTATIYSSTTLVVMAVWSCVELAGERLPGYDIFCWGSLLLHS